MLASKKAPPLIFENDLNYSIRVSTIPGGGWRYCRHMSIGRPAKFKRSSFGTRLITARLRLGLTQNETADLIGVSQQTYAGWERRTAALRPEHMAQLIKVLKINPLDLLGLKKQSVTSVPEGRAYRLLLAVSKLPPKRQTRVLDLVEELFYSRAK